VALVKNTTDAEMSVFVFAHWQKICTEVRALDKTSPSSPPPPPPGRLLDSRAPRGINCLRGFFCEILNSCYRSRLRRAGIAASVGAKRDVIKLPSGFRKRWNKINKKRSMHAEKREGEEKEKN
jgi:hypothetical protein